jgi:hypothetical protein
MNDLKLRVQNYERAYQPVDDANLSYVKVINFRSQLVVNKVPVNYTVREAYRYPVAVESDIRETPVDDSDVPYVSAHGVYIFLIFCVNCVTNYRCRGQSGSFARVCYESGLR